MPISNASPTPAIPYVAIKIESDDYGTSDIRIYRADGTNIKVPDLTIGTQSAEHLSDANTALYKEAVGIVAAAGGEAKLLYLINSRTSEQVTLKAILDDEDHSQTFRALLFHDPIYNAAMAKRQKAAETAAQEEKIRKQKERHADGLYYRYINKESPALPTLVVEANTYEDMKAKITALSGLNLFEDEWHAYGAYNVDPGNANKKPILEKYFAWFSFDEGSDATSTADDIYKAELHLIQQGVDIENMEVCLPITLKE